MNELPIFDCHIHLFTKEDVPRYFLRFQFRMFWGTLLSMALKWGPLAPTLWRLGQHFRWFDHDIIRRYARFFVVGKSSQEYILNRIERQYPPGSFFVALPMDMEYMGVGDVEDSIDLQHKKLLEIARQSAGHVIPFYAADPRRKDIGKRVRENLEKREFRGVKIYPNLGYRPTDPRLYDVYQSCVDFDVPVMTHCSASGTWAYGLTPAQRARFSHPHNYKKVLDDFPDLRLCLAHFGSSQEWVKHLRSPFTSKGERHDWLWWIVDMITSDKYPNLFTDIAYTLFTPTLAELYFDFVDYLKVLMTDKRIAEHVLYGSDYYMVESESLSEKEVSLTLRSRLGEDLYFQIAHHNTKKYLGIPKEVNSPI